MNKLSGWIFILTFQILLAFQVHAADVNQSLDHNTSVAVENELQKNSILAQKEADTQSSESYLKNQEKAAAQANIPETDLQERTALDISIGKEEKHQETKLNENATDDKKEYSEYTLTAEPAPAVPDPFLNVTQKRHEFDLSTEVYYYKYTEDSIDVKTDGIKGGLLGSYQFRIYDPEEVNAWGDFLKIYKPLNLFRLEGRVSYGEVEYEGSGSWDGIPDFNAEARGLLGLEVAIGKKLLVTPFSGFGYRYLYNQLSDYPASVINGQQYYSGYDRESKYAYIPIGLEAKRYINFEWSFTLKTEFDFFIWGEQISHLEDMEDQNGVNPGYDKLENDQEDGYGWRASLRLTRENGLVDFFVEPFVRYWKIDDSEVSLVTVSGSYVCNGNLCSAGYEPENETWEAGLNVGVNF